MRALHPFAASLGAGLIALAQPAIAADDPPPSPPPTFLPAAPPAPDSVANNSGQNVTRPLTRFDTRFEYSDLPDDRRQETITLRVDKPFNLAGGWKLNTRFDFPMVLSSVSDPDNPNAKLDLDVNDVLTQILLVTPSRGGWSFTFGSRIVAPFAKQGDRSSGKWKLGPTVSVSRDLPGLGKGSFVGLLLRDTFSFAGRHSSADTNVLSVQPSLDLELPHRWFVTFEPEIKLNAMDRWKAFVPANMTVGKKVTDRIVVSLEGNVALVDTYQNYDWKTEFRIGFFF